MLSKDAIPLDAGFPFTVLDQRLRAYYDMDRTFHWHECLEISFVRSGSGRYFIEDRVSPVAAGDIVVINNIEPHYLEVDGDGMHQQVFVFDPALLEGVADTLKIFFDRGSDFDNRITPAHGLYPEIAVNLESIHREFLERQEGWAGVIQARLMLISTLLYRNMRSSRALFVAPGTKRLQLAKIQEVLDFISLHYTEECTLNDAAERAHMTPSWFSAVFKRACGEGFVECLNRVCIDAACTRLRNTDAKIITVANNCGFANTAHFNRMFRRLKGMTPSVFRGTQ